jgi:hypothetical protein
METGKRAAPGANQRKALKESEQQASENRPGSFKDQEAAEKVVQMAPAGLEEKSTRGLDS